LLSLTVSNRRQRHNCPAHSSSIVPGDIIRVQVLGSTHCPKSIGITISIAEKVEKARKPVGQEKKAEEEDT
jgi:hypothetical protein